MDPSGKKAVVRVATRPEAIALTKLSGVIYKGNRVCLCL
jgi:hypothetical protein